jgi:hypothetical protein
MSATSKAQAIMRDLKERLQRKLPSTYVLNQSEDASGSILLISADATPAAGEQVVAIRIEAEKTAFTDVLGLAQKVYAPLRAQVIEESSTIAGVSLITLANRLQIDLEIARTGLKQERYMNANATVPAISQFSADGSVASSTLIASVPFDMYWPLSGQ